MAKFPPLSRRFQQAFTLIELMVGLAILGILIATAAPSFVSLFIRNEIITNSNNLIASLSYARSQAISRQQTIHVCQIEKGEQKCSSNYGWNRSWSNGWLIFEDSNANNNFDPDSDPVLRIVELNGNTKIVFNQRGRLRFFADGSARSAGYYLCSHTHSAAKHIYLLYSGRARINNKISKRQHDICKNRG